MWPDNYVEDLADICTRQAALIKAQADMLRQLGAVAQEDEALAARFNALLGDMNMTENRRSE